MVFRYQHREAQCTVAFNAIPIHLENTKFPAVGPRVLNLSTRGSVCERRQCSDQWFYRHRD